MIQTECNGCQFATFKDGDSIQTGCSLGRSKILNPNNETRECGEKTYQICDRFCNCYRPTQWADSLSDDAKTPEETVMDEISPRVGFFIYLNTDSSNAIDDLKRTVNCIKNQKGHKARYVAVVHGKVEYNLEISELLSSSFDHDETHYHTVLNILREDKLLQIDDAFTHALNGWVFVTTSGEDVPLDLIDKVHQRVNIDMRRLVIVEPYSDLNGFIFQTALFKYIGGNKPMLESTLREKISPNSPEDKTIQLNTESFLERVKNIPTDDKDTIVSWKEFMDVE